jgi:hypothetical protein
MREVVAGDFTLVTHNARDFRGGGEQKPGGHHAQEEIHAGLVCLISAKTMDRERQKELFAAALAYVQGRDDLVNHCVEVTEDESGEIVLTEYGLPAAPGADNA